jgi:hypothetical protein
VRIDRSDSSDGPEDARVARSGRSAPDDPDAAGKHGGTAVSGDGPSHSPSASSDTTLRTERFAAHCAKIEAVYRQYAIDHGLACVEKLERDTVTPGTRSIEAEDAKPHPVGLNDRSKGRGRLGEPGHLTKDETRQASADATAADSGMPVQNAIIFLDEIEGAFDPAAPWGHVSPRHRIDEDGNKISEWITSIDSLREFFG